jgi:hypothetical protein
MRPGSIDRKVIAIAQACSAGFSSFSRSGEIANILLKRRADRPAAVAATGYDEPVRDLRGMAELAAEAKARTTRLPRPAPSRARARGRCIAATREKRLGRTTSRRFAHMRTTSCPRSSERRGPWELG